MQNFKVAMVQHQTTTTDKDHNANMAEQYIKEAAQNNADFVLFPECWLTSYSPPDICRSHKPIEEIKSTPEFKAWYENTLTEGDKHITQICRSAKEQQIGVLITGFTKGKSTPQNTAFVIDQNGQIILKYSKVHTCDFDWERCLESGDAFKTCMFNGINIGVMICYDREYPESARELALQGAELIMVPNFCGDMPPRLKELSVRAMENMVGIAMANPPGKGLGSSCAYNPMVWDKDENGNHIDNAIIVAGEEFCGIVYANFDIDKLRKHRSNEDLGKYRKPHAYRHLT